MIPKKSAIKLPVLLFITFLLVLMSVQATTTQKVSIIDEIDDSNVLTEKLIINLVNNSKESMTFNLPDNAQKIILNGQQIKGNNKSIVVLLDCSECVIEFSFKLDSTVKKLSSDSYEFIRTIDLPVSPNKFSYSVKLPIGMILNLNDSSAILPVHADIRTDGSSIVIEWFQEKPVFPQLFRVVFSDHEKLEGVVSEFKGELTEWPVWVLAAITFLLGLLVGAFFNFSKFFDKQDRAIIAAIPLSLLNPDEQKVLEVISKSNSHIKQKEIVNTLGWSKSKVSSIITNLEYKKIIRREKIGRNYDVFLIKEFGE
jgi:hypothetical protein